MKYISLFSGIEAATVAVKAAGLNWEPLAFCENDPELRKFLQCKYPGVNLLGDIKSVDFRSFRPNLIVGGSPCQDFSIGGKMAGINGSRSSLFREYIRVVKETGCDYFVWENVYSPPARTAAAIIKKELKNYGIAEFKIDSFNINGIMRRKRLFVIGARNGIDRIAREINGLAEIKNKRTACCYGVALTRSGFMHRYAINSIPCLRRDGNKRPLVIKTKEGFKIYNPKAEFYEALFGLPLGYTKELGSNFKRVIALGNTFDVNVVGSIFKAINNSVGPL